MNSINICKWISWQIYENEVFIINEKNSQTYYLDGVGSDIWKNIIKYRIESEVINEIKKLYNKFTSEVNEDVAEFIESLEKNEIVYIKEINT